MARKTNQERLVAYHARQRALCAAGDPKALAIKLETTIRATTFVIMKYRASRGDREAQEWLDGVAAIAAERRRKREGRDGTQG